MNRYQRRKAAKGKYSKTHLEKLVWLDEKTDFDRQNAEIDDLMYKVALDISADIINPSSDEDLADIRSYIAGARMLQEDYEELARMTDCIFKSVLETKRTLAGKEEVYCAFLIQRANSLFRKIYSEANALVLHRISGLLSDIDNLEDKLLVACESKRKEIMELDRLMMASFGDDEDELPQISLPDMTPSVCACAAYASLCAPVV